MASLLRLNTAIPLLTLGGLYFQWSTIKSLVHKELPFVPGEVSTGVLTLVCVGLVLQALWSELESPMRFVWNCFFKPISNKTGAQSERLDSFYTSQANLYDATRGGLLKGRTTMLELVAGHLQAQGPSKDGKKKIWVDIGGGTGWNIEQMASYMPLSDFDAIYLIDLCEPLLDVARKRFAAKGWTNVICLKQDASEFVLPEWEAGQDPRGSLTVATLSYSLSMIPSFYPLLDRINAVLDPEVGLLGVADFYVAKDEGTAKSRAIGSSQRKVGWLSRWFWQIWFDFDHVNLGPARRDYLEYKFGTIKSYNGRNNFILPWIVQIPYYVFLGCSRSRDISKNIQAFDVDSGNVVGLAPGLKTPASPFQPLSPGDEVPELHLGSGQASVAGVAGASSGAIEEEVVVDLGGPPSSFHYLIKKPVRVPYMEEKVHSQFRTHIYGFTWEDPQEDMKALNLTKDDSMLVITSAGDNALHYAIAGGPKRIHAVDMNPAQGHILELKLAAAQALSYEEFYSMFGEGKLPQFKHLLDTKLAPYLTSHCYQYWSLNESYFAQNFHFRGYSGHALRLAQWAFWLSGITKDVKKMTEASNVWEQDLIWKTKVRPVLLHPFLVKILGSPIFLWNGLGVPINQMNCFLEDGSVKDFLLATFDPIPKLASMRTGAYHYLLCLTGRYTPQSCPLYLTRAGFEELRKNDCKAVDSFRLHTDTIINVLRGLPSSSLTKIIVMDSMDWFTPFPASTPLPPPFTPALDLLDSTPEAALESLKSELDYQVLEMKRVLAIGGEIYYRSAGKRPWYNQRFELAGFDVQAISIREDGKAIDRVNMYASFYRATLVKKDGRGAKR